MRGSARPRTSILRWNGRWRSDDASKHRTYARYARVTQIGCNGSADVGLLVNVEASYIGQCAVALGRLGVNLQNCTLEQVTFNQAANGTAILTGSMAGNTFRKCNLTGKQGAATYAGLTIENGPFGERRASVTIDPPSLAAGAGEASERTISVNGAQIGDRIVATTSVDMQGVEVRARVSAAGVVKAQFVNPATNPAGTVDLPSLTLTLQLYPA